MQRSNREIWYALIAIVWITIGYALVMNATQTVPNAGGVFGHLFGIFGFGLMLMTETLYSLRKRIRVAGWGRMSHWLQFHIFTGLVGPYLVLLHTSWKYNGLAGVLTLFTVVIVISGIIGRYIYTAIPRSADDNELVADDLERQIEVSELDLRSWFDAQPEMARILPGWVAAAQPEPDLRITFIFERIFSDIRYRWQWWRTRQHMPAAAHAQILQLERLQNQRRALDRQLASLAVARRMLSVWHSIHIPIGLTLFTIAFIHIGGALYYTSNFR